MSVFVWVLQGLLAAAFGAAGIMKVSQPKAKLAANMGWVEDFSDAQVKAIGAIELLAGIGLILPAATGIATILTPLAAAGLVIVMILAGVVHARRGESSQLPINAVLLILAAVIAWARFGPYSF